MIKQLSRELEKRYHLVQAEGESKVGQHFLSRYRFAHTMFQQFLYNDLSAGERRLLHGDVALALEALYEGRTEASAVQLAHHYAAAGDEAKAAAYEIQAGDASKRAFAYTEARLHYRHALELLTSLEQTPAVQRTRIDTTINYVDSGYNSEVVVQLFTELKAAERFLQGLPLPLDHADRTRRAYLHGWLAYLHEFLNDSTAAFAYAQPLLEETKALGNQELSLEVAGLLGWIYALRGRFAQSLPLLTPSVANLDTRVSWPKWVQSATGLSFALAGGGRCAEGIAMAQKCVWLGQEAQHDLTVATGHGYLALIYLMIGDDIRTFEAAQSCIQAAERGNELSYVVHGYTLQGFAQSRQGQHELARQSIERAQQLAQRLNSAWLNRLLLLLGAEIALHSGHYAEAIAQSEQVVALAQTADNLWIQGRAQRTWAQALAADLTAGEQVAEHLAASLDAFGSGAAHIEAAHTHAVWGQLLAQREQSTEAQIHLAQAAAQYEQAGLLPQLADVRALLGAASSAAGS